MLRCLDNTIGLSRYAQPGAWNDPDMLEVSHACYAMPCHAMQCRAVPCYAMLHYAMLCCVTVCWYGCCAVYACCDAISYQDTDTLLSHAPLCSVLLLQPAVVQACNHAEMGSGPCCSAQGSVMLCGPRSPCMAVGNGRHCIEVIHWLRLATLASWRTNKGAILPSGVC